MNVEQVDEDEDRLAAMRRQPLIGRAYHQRRPAGAREPNRDCADRRRRAWYPESLRESLEAERAVVGVEAAVEPQLPFKKDAADEGAGLIAMALQYRRQGFRSSGTLPAFSSTPFRNG